MPWVGVFYKEAILDISYFYKKIKITILRVGENVNEQKNNSFNDS